MLAKLMSTSHSIQLSTLIQTLVQLNMKLFQVGLKLSAISYLFKECGYLPIKHRITIQLISLPELIYFNLSNLFRWNRIISCGLSSINALQSNSCYYLMLFLILLVILPDIGWKWRYLTLKYCIKIKLISLSELIYFNLSNLFR